MKRWILLGIFLFGLWAALAGCSPSPAYTPVAPTPIPTPLPTPPPPTATSGAPGLSRARIPFMSFGTWQNDVAFCRDQAQPLLMDVYYPDESKRSPAPVGVFLPQLGLDKNAVDTEVLAELLNRGYVVAAVNWRQPSAYAMQIGIEDVKCAVRHLRANAAAYKIDANRIGAWGCSFGGTLAALLGMTDAAAALEGKSGFPDQSSRIQAVAARDGVYDWHTFIASNGDPTGRGFASLDDPMIGRTSPMSYVSKDAPPFLIFRSDLDSGIGPEQFQGFFEALQAAGVPATLVHIQGAVHCQTSGTPSAEQRAAMIADFFDKTLY